MSSPDRPEGERIAKLLARAGVASRREIERMIAEGRVALNGVKLDTPATILPHLRGVTVDGNPVAKAEPTRLYRFHKPAGLITAERDPAGRPTIYTALRNALPPGSPRLMPIGRLDFNTEGLLLLTNDGGFKREMELPATGVPRTYRARTYGDISQGQLEDLMDGIEIEGVRYGPIDANMERRTGRNQWVELTLTEGKNREVRRVLEHLGLEVSRLIRTAYGLFGLGDLGKGQAVEVRKEELERFRSSLKGAAPRREGAVHSPKPPTPRPQSETAPDEKAPRSARHPSRGDGRGDAKPTRPDAKGGVKGRGRHPSRADADSGGKSTRPTAKGDVKGRGRHPSRTDADGGAKSTRPHAKGDVKGRGRHPSRADADSGAKSTRPDAKGGVKGRGRPASPPRKGPRGPRK